MPHLTPKQRDILDFIQGYSLAEGYSPTHREIAEAFGYSSYGTVHKHLKALRSHGFVSRDRYKSRGTRIESVATDQGVVPMLGRVAAGGLVEAFPVQERVAVPQSLCSTVATNFALQVDGESMIDAGILSGDVVVVDSNRQAKSGDLVVARVNSEVTLKRLRLAGAEAILVPANASYQPTRVKLNKLHVQGVVVGLMRMYGQN